MLYKFTKMHGAGNDYIYIDGFNNNVPQPLTEFIIYASNRHKGIGGDGVVLILPSEVADCKMRMFNADGSEGKMCGNAIRCVAKYIYEHGIAHNDTMTIETASGIKTLTLNIDNNKVSSVMVEMGKADYSCDAIPLIFSSNECINQPLTLPDGNTINITAVSMGNPHAVIICDNDVLQMDIEKIGQQIEHHQQFPQRTNTEFINIHNGEITMRVWERGSDETMACGTGACASVAAAVRNNKLPIDTFITVHLRGGELNIRYNNDNTITMQGTATEVFEGTIEY